MKRASKVSQRVPNFGALNLTTLTAKTYTTQHDGEFLDYTDFKVYFLDLTLRHSLRRGWDAVKHPAGGKEDTFGRKRRIGGKNQKCKSFFLTKPSSLIPISHYCCPNCQTHINLS
jgi:hypothetical protein